MRTARSSSRPGGLHPPAQASPRTRHPPDQAPPRPGTPPGPDPVPPWTEFLTHTCENITLPQALFAGGKNLETWQKIEAGSLA